MGKIMVDVSDVNDGGRECERPKSVDEAAIWRAFDQTLAEAREAFSDLLPDVLQAIVDEAVAWARRQ